MNKNEPRRYHNDGTLLSNLLSTNLLYNNLLAILDIDTRSRIHYLAAAEVEDLTIDAAIAADGSDTGFLVKFL